MIDCKNIILGSLARVGDRVFGNVKPDSDRTNEQRAIDGKLGVVFAFHEWKDYQPRFGNTGHKPGIYQRLGATIVRWDDGTGGRVSEHDLAWWPWEAAHTPEGLNAMEAVAAIKTFNEERCAQRQASRPKENEYEAGSVYLGELPEIAFYEDDRLVDPDGVEWLVERINWQYYGERRSDGSFMPLLDVRCTGEDYRQSHGVDEFKLVERGNVWKWYHGEAASMTFADVSAEARFYSGLGRSKPIMGPQGHYGFTLEEAVEAVRAGQGDAIATGGGLLGSRKTLHVHKYDDAEPATRIRALTLEGFAEVEA